MVAIVLAVAGEQARLAVMIEVAEFLADCHADRQTTAVHAVCGEVESAPRQDSNL
jgi:hypothetical protein